MSIVEGLKMYTENDDAIHVICIISDVSIDSETKKTLCNVLHSQVNIVRCNEEVKKVEKFVS